MKIYTNTFDISQPILHKFWVAPFSDFKIGVKVVNKGEDVAGAITVMAGDAALVADDDKVDGFTVFAAKSEHTGTVQYTVTVAGINEPLKLIQMVSDSTVFDFGGDSGIDMSNYYTKVQVDGQLSVKADEDDLSAFYTKNETSSSTEISTALNDKVVNLSSVSGIMKISETDYAALSASGTTDQNVLYVIVPDAV